MSGQITDAGRPPSVDALARSLRGTGLPHPLLVQVSREAIAASEPESAPARAASLKRSLLGRVINATGVLLHTNLGRAPLGADRIPDYLNLEIDMDTGERGLRGGALNAMLALATGAEGALVVNNGAAAVLLTVATLAAGADVIISRGELVEIGGSFRVPEVLEASGAHLVEVGTTNRTRLDDYRSAIQRSAGQAIVLKVHQSNYRIVGFTASVDVASLATLGATVVYDIGSGLLDATTPWLKGPSPSWLAGEPAARQSLSAGAELVTFSADKLFGGPQAGIVAGSADLVERCARHPLARALRAGSLVLSSLQETVMRYLERDGAAIPFWRMANLDVGELEQRARSLGVGTVVRCPSVAGGGSLPGLDIPSAGVGLPGDHTAALRRWSPPVMARTSRGHTICDLRTVQPDDDAELGRALRSL